MLQEDWHQEQLAIPCESLAPAGPQPCAKAEVSAKELTCVQGVPPRFALNIKGVSPGRQTGLQCALGPRAQGQIKQAKLGQKVLEVTCIF